jgi:hypothetical protein
VAFSPHISRGSADQQNSQPVQSITSNLTNDDPGIQHESFVKLATSSMAVFDSPSL